VQPSTSAALGSSISGPFASILLNSSAGFGSSGQRKRRLSGAGADGGQEKRKAIGEDEGNNGEEAANAAED
jgi:hypothetical protein